MEKHISQQHLEAPYKNSSRKSPKRDLNNTDSNLESTERARN